MRKALCAGGKGRWGDQISPATLRTHLRGPPVLSYGHFGSNWKLDQPAVFGSEHSTDGPKCQPNRQLWDQCLQQDRGTHRSGRNQTEIISAGGSGKYLDLITWPDRPFRHGAGVVSLGGDPRSWRVGQIPAIHWAQLPSRGWSARMECTALARHDAAPSSRRQR
jgi:hypothetical protein